MIMGGYVYFLVVEESREDATIPG
jgi:hypothetical protein